MKQYRGRVSTAITFFKDGFLSRYNLKEYTLGDYPVVMFGLYHQKDYEFYLNHKGKIIVVWCGTDAMLAKKDILVKRHAKHIAISKFISNSLQGIEHIIYPVSPTKPVIDVRLPGEYIYHYGDKPLYRPSWIPEIEKKTGISVLHAIHNTVPREKIKLIYEKCFIGLRLTDHDGLPNTVIELGLMGRRSIYNGGTPHSIPWKTIDDVCESIVKEKENLPDPVKVAYDWYQYINKNEWLNWW